MEHRVFAPFPDGSPRTTSILIAEKFGKQHKHVLQMIGNLECSQEFSQRNFAPRDYVDARGKPRPMYEVTRDGFLILAMGFTLSLDRFAGFRQTQAGVLVEAHRVPSRSGRRGPTDTSRPRWAGEHTLRLQTRRSRLHLSTLQRPTPHRRADGKSRIEIPVHDPLVYVLARALSAAHFLRDLIS